MPRRFLWILLFITPLVIVALAVWHVHSKKLGGISGLTHTDLSISEYKDATHILQQERNTWSKLNSVGAHIKITFGNTNGWRDEEKLVSMECDVSLQQLGDNPISNSMSLYIYPYAITISNRNEGWIITSPDGTRDSVKIDCQDKQKNPRNYGLTLNDLVTVPSIVLTAAKERLLVCYNDSLFSKKGYPDCYPSVVSFFNEYPPWRNPKTSGTPHSYVFRRANVNNPHFANGYFDRLFFTDGHFSGYTFLSSERGTNAVARYVSFEELTPINGLWFPTKAALTFNDMKVEFEISDVVASVK